MMHKVWLISSDEDAGSFKYISIIAMKKKC